MIRNLAFILLCLCSPAIAGVHFDQASSENLDCTDWDDITGDITVFMRVSVDDFPSSDLEINHFLRKNWDGTTEGFYLRLQQASGTDYLEGGSYNTTNGDSIVQWAVSGWSAGDVHTIAMTCTNSTKVWELFFDGASVATSSAQSNCAEASAELTIGGGNSSRYGDVRVYQAAIWSSVLSDDEISLLDASDVMLMPLQVDDANLEAFWTFLDHPDGTALNAGETYSDYSGNGRTCTESDGSPDAVAEPTLTYS